MSRSSRAAGSLPPVTRDIEEFKIVESFTPSVAIQANVADADLVGEVGDKTGKVDNVLGIGDEESVRLGHVCQRVFEFGESGFGAKDAFVSRVDAPRRGDDKSAVGARPADVARKAGAMEPDRLGGQPALLLDGAAACTRALHAGTMPVAAASPTC